MQRSRTQREEILALERQHVWPPYTSSEVHESEDPLVIREAHGNWLYDFDGNQYLDAVSSWWTCTLGHDHPRLRKVLREQSEKLIHVAAARTTHEEIATLARDLIAIAPEGLSRVHFSDNGSSAVEVALKIAFQYWQQNGRASRTKFLCFASAYHGDTLGAASVASMEEFAGVFGPILFPVVRAALPKSDLEWEEALHDLEDKLRAHRDQLAAVIVEPLVQGAGGMRMHTPAVLKRVRDLCTEHDVFLIADEVFTGYGRTGSMFACDRAGIAPDLMCIGKGFTAGILPMAATLASSRIYDGFRGGPERSLMHGHTFCGHPLGASIAKEVLAIYRDESVLEGIAEREQMIADAMNALDSEDSVLRTRHLGMIGAVDLSDDGYRGKWGRSIFEEGRKRGIYLRPLGDTAYLCPALNIETSELRLLLDRFVDSVRAVIKTSSCK